MKTTTEMEALKSRLQATWSDGDFGQIAKSYTRSAEDFVQRLNLQPGMTVLDVACGTGNLALPAARIGATVTGIDIAPNLIEQARENAARENLKASFDVADAEDLPYGNGAFDVVATMFGAMFAPRPEVVAEELKRVCRSGGRIAMANWTPTGFAGRMFKVVGAYVPPPEGMPPPVLWGDETVVQQRLSEGISKLETRKRTLEFVYPFSAAEVVEHFRNYFGPVKKAFDSLDEQKQAALRQTLEEHWSENNRATDGTYLGDSEYLEVVAVRA